MVNKHVKRTHIPAVFIFLDYFTFIFTALKKINFMYLFLAVLGLPYCVCFLLVAGRRGLLFIAVHGFSLQGLLLLLSTGSRALGLQ